MIERLDCSIFPQSAKNKLARKATMKNLIAVAVTLFLLAGCVTGPQPESVLGNQSDVLILSPQGIDPSKDTVGFNNLVRNITQAFSKRLQESLQIQNLKVANVLD